MKGIGPHTLKRVKNIFVAQMERAQAMRAKRTYQDAWYPSPICIPESRCGNVSITHRVEKGDSIPVVGIRQAFNRGIKRARAMLKEPLIIHELRDKNRGVWMTDCPEELNQIYEMVHDVQPHGDVLIGGLGLGILPEIISNTVPEVDSMAVVEIDKRVIKLVAGGWPKPYKIINDDILHFLKTNQVYFDCYLLDTWQMTNETAWWSDVLPQRRAIRQRWGKRPVIHCWAEDIMRGSVEPALQISKGHWFYKGLPPMTAKQAAAFCENAGLPAWEKRYGAIVDANYKRDK